MENNVQEVLSKLNKRTRDRLITAEKMELKKFKLASVGLTKALGGGFGFGRQNLVWGRKSAGKSALLMQSIGEGQKEGLVCAWVDVENSFDKDWASRLGVDVENLLLPVDKTDKGYVPIKSTKDMVEIVSDLMIAGVDVVVVDSITPLVPTGWYDKKDELKGLEGTRQIGTQSVDLSNACKLLNAVNKNTCLILIAQSRTKIETWGAQQRPTGGNAVEFYSSSTVRLSASPSDKEQIKGTTTRSGKEIEANIGREVTWLLEYNKVSEPSQSGVYDFYYSGEKVGVDSVGELIAIAINLDIINQGGAWFTYGDQKFQGKHNVIGHFKENPDALTKLVGEIHG